MANFAAESEEDISIDICQIGQVPRELIGEILASPEYLASATQLNPHL